MMLGPKQEAQGALFYEFSIDNHVPQDHLLRSIDRFVDLSSIRPHLAEFYSHTGRPSIDPELLIRMLLVGYCLGIRSERRLCEEVHLNLAYRWFCRLDLSDPVPNHSTFSKNRHGRFRDSDLLRHLFETTVARCIAAGLVSGQRFAADASLIEADANIERFMNETSENNETYKIGGSAHIMGNSNWSFPIEFEHKQNARRREKPLATSTPNERLKINYTGFNAGVTRSFNRLSITLLGQYADFSFDDGVTLNDTSPIIFSDNDRERYGGLLRFRYDIPRGKTGTDFENILYTNLIYGHNKYDNLDYEGGRFGGPNQDHDEYGFLTGFMTNYKGLIKASVGAGLKHLSFDDARLKDSNTTNLSANIAYNLTPKMTLNFDAMRGRDQDTGLTEGVVSSTYGLGLDYELQHNLYAGLSFGYNQYDFESIGRKDEDYSSSVYLKYLNNRNLESVLRLNYRDRESTDNTREFDRLEVIFSLVGKI